MMFRLTLLLLFACLSMSLSAGPPADRTVIVLSWDGVRHDYPDRGEFPALARMEHEGIRGDLTPIYPSKTFPTHVTMATGTTPDVHGIVDNVFWDTGRGELYRYSGDADWLDAEPVWITAQRQGVDAATYFWVGSESDWRGMRQRYRITPFDANRPDAAKLQQIFAWLDLPDSERPRLIMSYWHGTDHEGHNDGPDAPSIKTALAAQDALLGQLLNGIDLRGRWATTTVLLVSDHGMTSISTPLGIGNVLAAAGIPAQVHGGEVAQIFLEDQAQTDAAFELLSNMAHVTVYRGDALPFPLMHPTRTGDLVATTVPPYTLDAARPGRPLSAATHGYDPANRDMTAVFYALGRRVPHIDERIQVRQLDVAATITDLLGIEPPQQSTGKPMAWTQFRDSSAPPPVAASLRDTR